MVDISGRSPVYDIPLCEALHKVLSPEHHLKLLAPNIDPKDVDFDCGRLLNIIPHRLQNSNRIPFRAIKALMIIVNYIGLITHVALRKPDILHLQWLPLIEVSTIEKYFLKILRFIVPKTQLLLTIHNVYPHNSSETSRQIYRERFSKVEPYFDKFIVHLETTKKEFCSAFGISAERVKVLHHGVLAPKGHDTIRRQRSKVLKLIMFGNQSTYKGTDVFVDALTMLPQGYKKKVHALIVGKMYSDYLNKLEEKKNNENIEFIPEYVSDEDLYKYIAHSDIIVLPYREISQSGVLLLALSTKRLIITSDIPSFKETLMGLGENTFFENGNAASLSKLIVKYADNLVDENKQLDAIESLEAKYSWMNVAKKYRAFIDEM
ncbi:MULTISPECIES: glycosyltransferase [unclassified Fibrobacter]|uniref:glycosyltransferase n=1 Tax=unclassified Fibrobacter TaxID=2634177 RepID=UPI001E574F5A|nr:MULTISPECIES: glycosyltransferase [unclassified Fibrobacter]